MVEDTVLHGRFSLKGNHMCVYVSIVLLCGAVVCCCVLLCLLCTVLLLFVVVCCCFTLYCMCMSVYLLLIYTMLVLSANTYLLTYLTNLSLYLLANPHVFNIQPLSANTLTRLGTQLGKIFPRYLFICIYSVYVYIHL